MVKLDHDWPEALTAANADPRNMLHYCSNENDYSVRVITGSSPPSEQIDRHGGSVVQLIRCCPWSGKRLPRSLNRLYFDVLEKEHGFEDDGEFGKPGFPTDFMTDAWWRKRDIREDQLDPDNWVEEDLLPADYVVDQNDYQRYPGYRRSAEAPPHLCWGLADFMFDQRVMFSYLPHTREYGPRVLDLETPVDYQDIRIMPCTHCPICGTELPGSLRTEWLKRLSAMGLEESSPNIPDRLLSDTWWKDAGL